MTPERALEILKADNWILTRDQSHAMAQALESALKAERERAERAEETCRALDKMLEITKRESHQIHKEE